VAKKNKTVETGSSVEKFLDAIEPEEKRDDCRAIVKMMSDASKEPAKMWGSGIIGFGSYHYEYESGHSGDMCRIGFAPRKANIALYMFNIIGKHDAELKKMGKVKTSKYCVYINSLRDIDTRILNKLITISLKGKR